MRWFFYAIGYTQAVIVVTTHPPLWLALPCALTIGVLMQTLAGRVDRRKP